MQSVRFVKIFTKKENLCILSAFHLEQIYPKLDCSLVLDQNFAWQSATSTGTDTKTKERLLECHQKVVVCILSQQPDFIFMFCK